MNHEREIEARFQNVTSPLGASHEGRGRYLSDRARSEDVRAFLGSDEDRGSNPLGSTLETGVLQVERETTMSMLHVRSSAP